MAVFSLVALFCLPFPAEASGAWCRPSFEGGIYGPYASYYPGYYDPGYGYLGVFPSPVASAFVPGSPVQQHRLYFPDPIANFYFRSHAYRVYELRIPREPNGEPHPRQPRYRRTYYPRPLGIARTRNY
jgi:hypothetical protein